MSCKPNISIALCTRNGAKFLLSQLDSISAQTRLPDELVVCDDCSIDETVDIVRRFSASSLFRVKLVQNTTRLGPTKNFEQAIRYCTGTVIALCDQDDVWASEKLEKMETAFVDRPDAGLVCSDAQVVNEGLHPLGYSLWQSSGMTARLQAKMQTGNSCSVLLKRQVITGCTLAFRSTFIPLVVPIPETWNHDAWISFLIAASAPLLLIDEPLVLYRQHSCNHIGAKKKGFVEQMEGAKCRMRTLAQKELAAWTDLRGRVQKSGKPQLLANIDAKISHLSLRSRLSSRRELRMIQVLTEAAMLRYKHYSNGWKSVAADMFL